MVVFYCLRENERFADIADAFTITTFVETRPLYGILVCRVQ